MSDPLRLQRFSGPQVKSFIPDLAKLRILVFRDFPYLYDGDPEYEEKYLKTYTDSPESVVVVAFDGGEVVGASTGRPLDHETDEIQRPSASSATSRRRSSTSASRCCAKSTGARARACASSTSARPTPGSSGAST